VKDKNNELNPGIQRYEYSFSQKAVDDKTCFGTGSDTGPHAMKDNPQLGLHSLIKQRAIDMGQPFDIRTEFTQGANPGMKTVFQQKQKSSGTPGPVYVVYDTDKDGGAEGSNQWGVDPKIHPGTRNLANNLILGRLTIRPRLFA
jgi:hypothetical protein